MSIGRRLPYLTASCQGFSNVCVPTSSDYQHQLRLLPAALLTSSGFSFTGGIPEAGPFDQSGLQVGCWAGRGTKFGCAPLLMASNHFAQVPPFSQAWRTNPSWCPTAACVALSRCQAPAATLDPPSACRAPARFLWAVLRWAPASPWARWRPGTRWAGDGHGRASSGRW